MIALDLLVAHVLVALGAALVVTCTKAGKPIRLAWASVFRHRLLRWNWGMVMCPHCCSWWCGGLLTLWTTRSWVSALEVAFAACGVMLLVQRVLGRDRTFMVVQHGDGHEDDRYHSGTIKSVSLEPDEDFEKLLGLEDGPENEE